MQELISMPYTTLKIYTEPFSLNKTHRSTPKGIRYKTKEFKAWQKEVSLSIQAQKKGLLELKDMFNRKEHFLKQTINFHVPYKDLFTKKGEISLTYNDLSNCFKTIEDLVFDIAGKPLNDAQVLSMCGDMIADDVSYIWYRLELHSFSLRTDLKLALKKLRD